MDRLCLNDEELQQNDQAQKSRNPQFFNPNVMSSSSFTNKFCVFTRPEQTHSSLVARLAYGQQQDKEEVTVSICGVHKNLGYEDAKSAYAM